MHLASGPAARLNGKWNDPVEAALLSLCDHSSLPCKEVARSLARAGLEVREVSNGEGDGPCIVLIDRVDESICAHVRRASRWRLRHVLCLCKGTSFSEREYWDLKAAGASDVLDWCGDTSCAARVAARLQHWTEVDDLMRHESHELGIIGESPDWICAVRQVVEVSRYTTDSILITGESGTGKELMARLVHRLDPRAEKGQFVVLDCTTVVPDLSGSEFFGHERGAFTSAVAKRDGAFALADGGTLFLDEVGELPLRLQAELLRVIQEGTYKRVGSNVWKRSDFRLVCATNRQLQMERNRGMFRDDLYYRLATWRINLPPLRARGARDILALALYFVKEFCPGEDVPELHPVVKSYLMSQEYPGNVRDLRRMVREIVHRHNGLGPVTIGSIPGDKLGRASTSGQEADSQLLSAISTYVHQGMGVAEICDLAKEAAYDIAIREETGNTGRVAERLKVSPRAVQMHKSRYATSDSGRTSK